ncbi:hypothetical protein BDBG_17135, partial [Blastomyces gilchristii SLH14081]
MTMNIFFFLTSFFSLKLFHFLFRSVPSSYQGQQTRDISRSEKEKGILGQRRLAESALKERQKSGVEWSGESLKIMIIRTFCQLVFQRGRSTPRLRRFCLNS